MAESPTKTIAENRRARFDYFLEDHMEAGIALLHRKQIDKLIGAVQREGRTIIPVRLYLNERGMAKLEIALAKGKKIHDKREAVAERDWQRDKARLLRDKG